MLITTLVILLLGVISTGGVSIEEDLTLTFKQKLVLDDFKKILNGRLPHEYMYEDIFLIRWLRARNFRLKEAEIMLMQNLEWREKFKMDYVLQENWRQELRKQYKYYVDGEDKQQRPIVYVDAGEWDLRRAIISGQGEKVGRLIDSIFEEVNDKLRRMRQIEGKNVTQFYLVFDMDGFNLINQGCPRCIPLIARIVTTYENYYPGTIHKIMSINTPELFQPILQLVKSLMTQATRDIYMVYGRTGSTTEAQNILYNDIERDQLFYDLGGIRDLPLL